jgi:hypothetical protein
MSEPTAGPSNYFARHPIRLAPSWPTTAIALLNSGDDLQSASPQRPPTTTPTPETGDHDQAEEDPTQDSSD